MGIDTIFMFELPKPLTDEDLARFNFRLGESFGLTEKKDKAKADDKENNKYTIRNLWRLYSPGYARGPAIEIIALLRFIKDYFNGSVILYYGGDCDEVLSVWTEQTEKEMWEYFVQHGHSTYLRYDKNHLCPECNGPMRESGCQAARRRYSCEGCGYSTWKD